MMVVPVGAVDGRAIGAVEAGGAAAGLSTHWFLHKPEAHDRLSRQYLPLARLLGWHRNLLRSVTPGEPAQMPVSHWFCGRDVDQLLVSPIWRETQHRVDRLTSPRQNCGSDLSMQTEP